jgi:uncharacterized membrane protein
MLEQSLIGVSLILILIAIVVMIKVKPPKDKKNEINNLLTLAIMLLCSIIAYTYQLSNIAGSIISLSITFVLFIIICSPNRKEGK